MNKVKLFERMTVWLNPSQKKALLALAKKQTRKGKVVTASELIRNVLIKNKIV